MTDSTDSDPGWGPSGSGFTEQAEQAKWQSHFPIASLRLSDIKACGIELLYENNF